MTGNLPATRHEASLSDRMAYAKALAASDLLPRAYQNKPANVLLAIEYAAALGLSPVAAIQGVHIVDAKPSASAQLIGALVRRAGHRLRVQVAEDGQSARATIVRADDPSFEFVSVWTMLRAQDAGLTGKGTWKSYPTNLLKARAITEVARDACPEVLSGVAYTPEELEQGDEGEAVTVITDDDWATPDPTVEPSSDSSPDEDEDIVDGEIVSDSTEPILRTEAQSRKIFTLTGKLNITDRADALRYISDVVGRDVPSSRELTREEASTVIDALEADLKAQS